jgi:diacylglycerol diphosphate phosphatase/phosphatidate phosphatase
MKLTHHPLDVMTGSALGVIFAFFSYRQYYPSLSSTLSHRPYSPRIPSLKTAPAPVVDIEQGNVSPSDHSSGVTLPVNRPFVGGRSPYNEQVASFNTYLAPNSQYQYPPRQGLHPGDAESYEMDTTSIDGTVKRPVQDLEEEWKRGGEGHEQH